MILVLYILQYVDISYSDEHDFFAYKSVDLILI